MLKKNSDKNYSLFLYFFYILFKQKGLFLPEDIVSTLFKKCLMSALSKERLFRISASSRGPKIKWAPRALIRSNTAACVSFNEATIRPLIRPTQSAENYMIFPPFFRTQ